MAGAVCWYGCSIYNSSLLLPADSGVKDVLIPDVGTDAHDGGKEAAPNPCPDFEPPPKPAADDPSTNPNQSFVVAVHTIDVGFGDDAGTPGASGLLGYDLDTVYTCCDGGPESCNAAVTGAMHCDDPSGRDNAGGHLLATLASLDPGQFNTSTISQRLENGTYSILLQVYQYNGTANDTQVTAALYASDGVENEAGAMWDGNDVWNIDDAFVVSPDASPLLPNHIDGNAYVANGTLVMSVNFPISLGTSGTSTFTISLTSGIVSGQLVPGANGTYSLANGQIAGRWNVSDLLQSLQTVSVFGSPICPGTANYTFVKQEICQYADIMTDITKDKTGATCDALSLGIGFTADPAVLGDAVPAAIKMGLCSGDAGPDDCAQ
jgi:hypothetical protein